MKRKAKRLKSIKIQGFKSIPFQHPLELMFGDINILLGANGAGKSNIISWIHDEREPSEIYCRIRHQSEIPILRV